jgi:hypothetical protein
MINGQWSTPVLNHAFGASEAACLSQFLRFIGKINIYSSLVIWIFLVDE